MPVTQGYKAVLAFGAIYVIWGSTFGAIRFAVETIPPFIMTGMRCLVAGAVLYGWARWRGAPAPAAWAWLAALPIGAMLFPGGQGLLAWAELRVPTGVAALFVAAEPLWMMGFQVLGGEGSGGARTVAGITAGVLGLVLLASPGEVLGVAFDSTGTAALLAGGFLWAAGSAGSRRVTLRGSPFLLAGMYLIAGGMVSLLVGLEVGEGAHLLARPASLTSLVALLYLTVLGSVVAFAAYHWLLQRHSLTAVATHGFVNPVVAVGLGWLVLGETVTARVVVAMAFLVPAVALVLTGARGRFTLRATTPPARSSWLD